MAKKIVVIIRFRPYTFILLFGSVLSAVGSTVFWGNETTASRFVLSETSSAYSLVEVNQAIKAWSFPWDVLLHILLQFSKD